MDIIQIDGKPIRLVAFCAAFIGDMPQQQDNAGFRRQTATRGCRKYLVTEPSTALRGKLLWFPYLFPSENMADVFLFFLSFTNEKSVPDYFVYEYDPLLLFYV